MSAMNDSLDETRSLGEKAAIFRGTRGSGNVVGSAFIPLRSPLQPPNAVVSTLLKGNRKSIEVDETQMRPVPNPFPELLPSTVSLLSECLLPWTKTSATQVIKVYSEDNTSRAVEVPSDITARDICQLFILKNHCIDDHSWTLFEQMPHLSIERTIEDHESVMEVQSGWGMDSHCCLYFRKNYAKYEFFKKPLDFFPEHMVSVSSESNGIMNHSQLIQTFLSSSSCPEIHGFLHAKEHGRKSWKKFYFVLRRSGLYFSNKGTSKEPRHLQFIAEFGDSDVYTLLSAKKVYGAPTDYGFCVKASKSNSARDLKLLCADDEQTRTCWVTAMRLFKYGMQLYQNFIQPYQKQKSSPMRKSCHRLSSHGSPSTSQSSMSSIAIHVAQPWFHSKLSRDEAQKLITQQGLIDGVFLVRDSQSNPRTFVLSLCHTQKIKHFQIVPRTLGNRCRCLPDMAGGRGMWSMKKMTHSGDECYTSSRVFPERPGIC
ncbi:growth factor receptor-bound protein 14-like [Sinocyclocheilus anshuiensis]|uniref:growth factor receptor-bound protein 14-like n=1 Tax=Sinocyclocheilus anshuiensis TaxID=1608454 RepID=UPI0007B7AB56|nr:PREDICTED: growth factor receptor-bound protein 14-like [Sinocyclocheilus anshuiensis]